MKRTRSLKPLEFPDQVTALRSAIKDWWYNWVNQLDFSDDIKTIIKNDSWIKMQVLESDGFDWVSYIRKLDRILPLCTYFRVIRRSKELMLHIFITRDGNRNKYFDLVNDQYDINESEIPFTIDNLMSCLIPINRWVFSFTDCNKCVSSLLEVNVDKCKNHDHVNN